MTMEMKMDTTMKTTTMKMKTETNLKVANIFLPLQQVTRDPNFRGTKYATSSTPLKRSHWNGG